MALSSLLLVVSIFLFTLAALFAGGVFSGWDPTWIGYAAGAFFAASFLPAVARQVP